MNTKMILSMWFLIMTFGASPGFSAVVINEFLADPPPGLAGDANHDGVRSSSQDEFVELFNFGAGGENLSSWSIWDGSALRHQFAEGTALSSLERLVIFGGGAPSGIPDLVFTASSGTLSLNNAGDTITLKNKFGVTMDQIVFSSEADQDQSLVRIPEGSGPFRKHASVSPAGLVFSPGTDAEGKIRIPEIPTTPEPSTGLTFGLGLLIIGGILKKRRFNRERQAQDFH